MLIGLDHAIIAVRDLAKASKQLEHALGLKLDVEGPQARGLPGVQRVDAQNVPPVANARANRSAR